MEGQQMTHSQKQCGFTLLELMVVTAIVGIITSIAVPTYRHYVTRSQVSEGFALMGPAKTAVAQYCQNNNAHALNNAVAGIPEPEMITGRYVDQVTVANGVIYSRFGNEASSELRGQTVSLVPEDCGNRGWSCTTTISDNLLRQCKNDGLWKEGIHPSVTFPAGSESLAFGETHEFTWDGGAGPEAIVELKLYNPDDHSWKSVFLHHGANTGSLELALEDSLPAGIYQLNVKTFDHSYGCALADITGDYSASHGNKALAYSLSKDRTGWASTQAEALEWCNNSTHPGHTPTTDCEIVDVNGNDCTNTAGGQANSQLFSIGT